MKIRKVSKIIVKNTVRTISKPMRLRNENQTLTKHNSLTCVARMSTE